MGDGGGEGVSMWVGVCVTSGIVEGNPAILCQSSIFRMLPSDFDAEYPG